MANQFSSVQSLSHLQLFATPWTAACQASLSIIDSQSLLKLMSVESVMLSNHLILCCPLLLQSLIFPSIRVFSNESVVCIRWPKYTYIYSFKDSFPIQVITEYKYSFLSFDFFLSSGFVPAVLWRNKKRHVVSHERSFGDRNGALEGNTGWLQ